MTGRAHDLDVQQMRKGQQARDWAASNGILMCECGSCSLTRTKSLQDIVSKPLSLVGNADNPNRQDAQQNLDELFTSLVKPR